MRETHKNNYTAATQYITARMAHINSASVNAPGVNPRCISKADVNQNEFNGVNIHDPWRKFTDEEWHNQLGERGCKIVNSKRHPNRNMGGRGRGGRALHGGRGRGGRGRFGRGWHNRGGQDQNANNNNNNPTNGNQTINETTSDNRSTVSAQNNQAVPSTVSTVTTQTQASTSNDPSGQNGSGFGSNRPQAVHVHIELI
jgi:hypothetical protein